MFVIVDKLSPSARFIDVIINKSTLFLVFAS